PRGVEGRQGRDQLPAGRSRGGQGHLPAQGEAGRHQRPILPPSREGWSPGIVRRGRVQGEEGLVLPRGRSRSEGERQAPQVEGVPVRGGACRSPSDRDRPRRSEEHTSELQSRENLVCRLLLEKTK